MLKRVEMEKKGNSRFDFLYNKNIVKSKRSQITIFVIIAILLVLAFVIIFLVMKQSPSPGQPSDIQAIQSHVDGCVKEVFFEAINNLGFYENLLSQYVTYNIVNCDLSQFEAKGYNISKKDEEIQADIKITDYEASVVVKWPITINKEDFKKTYTEFSAKYIRYGELEVGRDEYLTSDDGKMILHVPKNAQVTLNGGAVRKITLKIENCLTLWCFGRLHYNLDPDGADISPKAELTIEYDELFIEELSGVDEESLRLAYYDPARDLWIAYEEQHVDTVNNKIIAKIHKI